MLSMQNEKENYKEVILKLLAGILGLAGTIRFKFDM